MTEHDRLMDQIAIRRVVDRYAHCADRRDPHGQAGVFASDGRVVLYDGDPSTSQPIDTVTGRDALAATFTDLIARYEATTYLNGQSTIDVSGDAATGETYCVAFHLLVEEGERTLLTMSIRYLDTFVRRGGEWLIDTRRLVFDWTDRRVSAP